MPVQVSRCAAASELQFHSELEVTLLVLTKEGSRVDASGIGFRSRRITDVTVGFAEVHEIEQVDCLSAKLYVGSFVDEELLKQRGVGLPVDRTA